MIWAHWILFDPKSIKLCAVRNLFLFALCFMNQSSSSSWSHNPSPVDVTLVVKAEESTLEESCSDRSHPGNQHLMSLTRRHCIECCCANVHGKVVVVGKISDAMDGRDALLLPTKSLGKAKFWAMMAFMPVSKDCRSLRKKVEFVLL